MAPRNCCHDFKPRKELKDQSFINISCAQCRYENRCRLIARLKGKLEKELK
jgi:hypothetical protein